MTIHTIGSRQDFGPSDSVQKYLGRGRSRFDIRRSALIVIMCALCLITGCVTGCYIERHRYPQIELSTLEVQHLPDTPFIEVEP